LLKEIEDDNTGAFYRENKVLVVAHSRTIRAFASDGVDKKHPNYFANTFYSENC